MTARTWVVGSGGLLGSAVTRTLRAAHRDVHQVAPISWGTPDAVSGLLAGLERLATDEEDWQVYWCAGAAFTDSSAQVLQVEAHTFEMFLDGVRRLPAATLARGSLVLCSSAGAAYAGARDAPFTEQSTAAPLGAYGTTKLQAEDASRRLSQDTGLRVLVARVANVYGPGQRLAKQQGLVSRLCLATVTRSPISVFVPLDTVRDYVYVDDCARVLVAAGDRSHGSTDGEPWRLKIVHSGRAVSIAALVGTFRQVCLVKPPIVMGRSASAPLHSRDLRLRSTVWTDLDAAATTTLAAGIHLTMQDVRGSIALHGPPVGAAGRR